MLSRKITAFGIPPVLGFGIIPVLFFAMSELLFRKTEYAPYLYVFLAISFVTQLSEAKRNAFLKSIFNQPNYLKLRAMENGILATPFLLFLAYKGQFLLMLIASLGAMAMALLHFNASINTTLPTPFGKKPFEFTVGFRRTFSLFPAAYFLTFMAILADNFNLGIFSLLTIGITCLSYYAKPENEYFVWNYNLTPQQFLVEKVKTGFLQFTLLSLPVLVALSIFFPGDALVLMAFFALCLVYLATLIFVKYAAFPHEINVFQAIAVGISFIVPPILLVITPLFYIQAVKALNTILK
tara:strand:+ start:567 stop:1454 length:888 start_codon:yes stop_codon:yes gene_type:complete